MILRTCYICGKTKPIEEFCKNKTKSLGREYRCYPCNRERVRNYYKNNTSKCQNTGRKHYKRNKHKYIARNKKYYHKNKEKRLASMFVNNYFSPDFQRKKPILKCYCCGDIVAKDLHHFDYSKPHEVIPLCRRCHLNIHAGNISIKTNKSLVLGDDFILTKGAC